MPKAKIDAKDALDDIRAGMDDAALMKKYQISAKGLQSLVKKLMDAGILQPPEVQNLLGEQEGSIVIDYSALTPEDSKAHAPSPSTHIDDEETPKGLLISDDGPLLGLIVGALGAGSYRISACKDAQVTAEVLGRFAPHFVILDVSLTRMNFLDVLRVAREFDSCLPVLLVTDAAHRAEAGRGIQQGAYGVLEKPLEALLTRTITRRCAEYGSLARLRRDHERIMETAIKEQTLEIVQTKDFLKGILDSSTLVSVVVTDTDQNVLFWNTGAENILGYSAEEMIGKKITKVYPPDSLTKDSVAELRNTLTDEQGTVHTKMRQKAKDGRILTIALAVTPLKDGDGEIRGILGMGLDMTEEVRQTKEIMKLLQKVKQTQDTSILALARLTEARDGHTGSHLSRVQEYCKVLCVSLAKLGTYGEAMSQRFMDDLVRSSVLHDVGKVLLPDSVLLFQGTYGPEERDIMRQHPLIGGRALQDAVKKLGSESYLDTAMEVAFYHHEHWDGNGYPFGLKEEEIPLSARILAVADSYDGLTTERTYRKAYTHEQACQIIMDEKGTHFDPRVITAFEDVEGAFRMIRAAFEE
jgi:PAS domain S-box-containing protein